MRNIPKNSHNYLSFIENNKFLNLDIGIIQNKVGIVDKKDGDYDSMKDSIEGKDKDEIAKERYKRFEALLEKIKGNPVEEMIFKLIVSSITKQKEIPEIIEMMNFDTDKNNAISDGEFSTYIDKLNNYIDTILDLKITFVPDPAIIGFPSAISTFPPNIHLHLETRYEHNSKIPIYIENGSITPKLIDNILVKISGQTFATLPVNRLNSKQSSQSFSEDISSPEVVPPPGGGTLLEGKIELGKIDLNSLNFNKAEINLCKKLGINSEVIAQLEILGKKNPEIIKSLKKSLINPVERAKFENNPRCIEVLLKAEKYANYQKFINEFAKVGGIVFACALIYDLEHTDNKLDFLAKTSVEFGGFMAGAMAAMKIPHPVAKLIVGLVAGMLASLGVGKLWDAHITPFLDKNMPNRNRDVSGWLEVRDTVDFINKIYGGWNIINTAELLLEDYGVAPLEVNEDPLVYLSKTVSLMPDDFGTVDYLVRENSNLKKAAEKTIYKLNYWKGLVEKMDENKISHSSFPKELRDAYISFIEPLIEKDKKNHGWLHNNLNYTSPKNIRVEAKNQVLKLIDEKIHSFDSIIDGTWLNKKSEELNLQSLYIMIATEGFKKVGIKGFPQAKIEEFMDNILKRANSKGALIETDDEYGIWKVMVDKSITFGGNKITFKDYFSLASLVQKQQKQVNDLKNHGNIRGERL